MEEQLWYMKRQSDTLQTFREFIRPLWDDEAGRQINRNLLDPHQEDDEIMVKAFNQQNIQLNESTASRTLMMEFAQTASELLQQIMELIERVDEDSERSVQYFQQYRSFYAEAKSMFPEIDQLLSQSNQVGKSTPYNPD